MAGVQEYESSFTGPTFVPPVYSQRYSFALETAASVKAKSVVDMGCAECKLLRLMRRKPHIEELVGVDIDFALLRQQEKTIQPLTTDYLIRRERPLRITLMHGSIAESDQRLVGCDLLTCIEVIEHLESHVLEKVPQSLFGDLHPKTVIVTTPNADFNVLFPGLHGFRHPDHKFEWSRAQFQSWCLEVAREFCYSVEFSGVGDPPSGQESLGHCSQIATFMSKGTPLNDQKKQLNTPYTMVAEVAYPHIVNPLSPEEKLCQEAVYYLSMLARLKRNDREEDESNGGVCEGDEIETTCNCCRGVVDVWTVHVSLKELFRFPRIQQLNASEDDIRSALKLSSAITLEHTNTCAVFQHEDKLKDNSDSSNTLGDEETAESDIGTVNISNTLQSDDGLTDQTAENWE